MVKKTFLCVLCLTAIASGFAQDEDFKGYHGILRAQATLSAGYNTAFKSVNYFLHGDLEYYFDEKLSVRSDVYYFLNSRTPSDAVEPFKFLHGLYTGFQYHFLHNNKVDLFVGLQPGLNLGQRQYSQLVELENKPNPLPNPTTTVAPIVSLNTGINYYAGKFFHLFATARYNTGWFSDNYSTASLSEFRVSFGLGFYLNTSKH